MPGGMPPMLGGSPGSPAMPAHTSIHENHDQRVKEHGPGPLAALRGPIHCAVKTAADSPADFDAHAADVMLAREPYSAAAAAPVCAPSHNDPDVLGPTPIQAKPNSFSTYQLTWRHSRGWGSSPCSRCVSANLLVPGRNPGPASSASVQWQHENRRPVVSLSSMNPLHPVLACLW